MPVDGRVGTVEVGSAVVTLASRTAGPPTRSPARNGRWTTLVPLSPDHAGFVHQLAHDDPTTFHPLFPAAPPEPRTLVERLDQDTAACFVVMGTRSRRPIGVAYLYEWSRQHGVALFKVSMVPRLRGTGVGIEAAFRFVSHVFSSFNIRKLYVTVESWQLGSVASAVGDLLDAEGRLREHSYFAGRWHDQWILSIPRDRMENRAMRSGGLRARLVAPEASGVDAGGGAAGRSVDAAAGDVAGSVAGAEAAPPAATGAAGGSSRWLAMGRETRPLQSARVRLVPAHRDHLGYLYDLSTSEEVGHRWRFGGAVPGRQEFQRRFAQGVFAQYVPCLVRTGRPFGHLVAYQADVANGHAYIGGVTESRLHRTGYPIEAFVLFMRHLFTNWSFRKLYMDLPEFNRSQVFPIGIVDGIREEARLRDFTYHDGAWWDRSIVAVTRQFFFESLGIGR